MARAPPFRVTGIAVVTPLRSVTPPVRVSEARFSVLGIVSVPEATVRLPAYWSRLNIVPPMNTMSLVTPVRSRSAVEVTPIRTPVARSAAV